jgi:C-terminal processing protease CtpA/Prc
VFTAERVAGWRMLIIDLRNNPGGEDQLGVNISARLTDRPYTAYTKAARNDPKDPTKHARTQTVTVTPADAPRYTGPIRLLTGPLTVSAGETFTLGLMARTPAPERFGETTQGVYSDTLQRKLPNGWTVTVGNEEYVGPDGKSYEGLGIPPTTPIPVFPPAELAANQDSVLAAALR